MNTLIARKQRNLALKAEAKPDQRIGGLFPLICQKEWMMQAMWNVLNNRGAGTAGVDGKVKATYYDAKARSLTVKAIQRIEEICQSLKDGNYHPQPVRRIYISKANGKKRPIGNPTLDDKTIQEAIRMVLEPIYESDFLDCSYGFRPNRNTMDAVTICRRYIQSNVKCYWVIEGDIKACFGSIDNKILLKLLRKRIADRKLVGTIHRFLKAGYQEDGIIHKPNVGIPQGGVVSPILMNVYLHELDKWWSEKYDLNSKAKTARRKAHLGNFFLVRFADDFIVLSNGTKESTAAVKEEIAAFLEEKLKLELSQEKTAITHASDGFDFLGFHIRKCTGARDPKGVVIKPSKSNIQKMRSTIAEYLNRTKHEYAVVNMIRALNPVIRGWTNYYRFVNSAQTFGDLDNYLCKKFLKWYRGKYRLPLQKGTRKGLRWIDKKESLHLYRLSEMRIERYSWRRTSNPYLEMNVKRMTDNPLPEVTWYGNAQRDADLQIQCFQRDDGVCQICMRPKTNLIAHDVIPVSKGGKNTIDNLVALCEDCHRKFNKELHYECRSLEEVRRLVGSRVRGNRACTVST